MLRTPCNIANRLHEIVLVLHLVLFQQRHVKSRQCKNNKKKDIATHYTNFIYCFGPNFKYIVMRVKTSDYFQLILLNLFLLLAIQ